MYHHPTETIYGSGYFWNLPCLIIAGILILLVVYVFGAAWYYEYYIPKRKIKRLCGKQGFTGGT